MLLTEWRAMGVAVIRTKRLLLRLDQILQPDIIAIPDFLRSSSSFYTASFCSGVRVTGFRQEMGWQR